MDKFKNRLRYFLIGLSIGVIFVYFVFGNRGCAWLPENRVKNMIGEKEIIVGDSILDIMDQLNLTNDEIYALLKDEGDVDFSSSITDQQPKIYHLDGNQNDEAYSARFSLDEEFQIAEVIAVNKTGKTVSSTRSNQQKSTLPLPHSDVIAILESHEFRILNKAQCQLDFYTISEEKIKQFHLSAKINIAESEPRLSPNPYYVMEGEIDGQFYAVTYIIGENRTRIGNIQGKHLTDCQEEL